MKDEEKVVGCDPWARLRFSIIGGLLAAPPEPGQLGRRIAELAGKPYRHPTRPDERVSFGASTIERWYYRARDAEDPVSALGRRVREDRGARRAMSGELLAELERQYMAHRRWSCQLHFDNLGALVAERPELGPMPSYATVRRRMRERGWHKGKSLPRNPTDGQVRAAERLERREVRGYEASHVHALWHLDFHIGRRRVAVARGILRRPVALAVLDDRSRLVCHIQWYLAESAANLVHGLSQAFAKRGLPRALMTDRGAAMLAGETRSGLERLGVEHRPTLPYSPYQNGKQEAFWGQTEGRLMAMLEGVESLRLDFLNRATQAWVEMEYNRAPHAELGGSPLERLLEGPDASRRAPGAEMQRMAFTVQKGRIQRRSDGTLTIAGIRFEAPSRFRHVRRLQVRYRSWDLAEAYLVDERDGTLLARIYPIDTERNADGRRRALEPDTQEKILRSAGEEADPVPPLMRRLLAEYAATGLPPAYLPREEKHKTKEKDHE